MATSVSVGNELLAPQGEIRRVSVGQPLQWLRLAWEDLKAIGGPGLAHGALIAILGAVLLMLGSTHLYLAAAAVTGYLLVGPAMTTGICELARRREVGEPLGFDQSLQPLKRNWQSLLQFTAALVLIAVDWFIVSALAIGAASNSALPSLSVALWGSGPSLTLNQALGYMVSGAVLAIMVFVVSVVAVPMIIDRNARAANAIRVSVRVTVLNLPAMLVWAGLIVLMTAIGFATLLVGMVVVAPLLGYATWHAYRDMVA